MITDGDFKGHHISVKRQIVSEEGEVVTIKVVTPFSERKTCGMLPDSCSKCPVGYMNKADSDTEPEEGKGYCGRNVPWPPYERPDTCKLQQFSVGKLLTEYFGLESALEFEDRKQQRQTIETMNGLLSSLRNYVDEDTSKAIDTTLHILSHIPVKGGEVE